jgi:hypothetical protein
MIGGALLVIAAEKQGVSNGDSEHADPCHLICQNSSLPGHDVTVSNLCSSPPVCQ